MAVAVVSTGDSESRIARFLREHELDDLVSNVRRNNPWADEKGIEALEKEVEATYRLCVELTFDGAGAARARDYELPVSRARNWRYKGNVPSTLLLCAVPCTPSTRKERLSFAYILGIHAKSTPRNSRGKKEFSPLIADKSSRSRALKKARVFLGDTLTEDDQKLKYPGSQLVHVLNHCLFEGFSSYVSTNEERVAFFQGFFDSSDISFTERGRHEGYKISRRNDYLFKLFTQSFFELGIFVRFNQLEGELYVSGPQNLARFQSLKLDLNALNRRKVAKYLGQPHPCSTDLNTYYRARSAVQAALAEGRFTSWARLAKDLDGISRCSLRLWSKSLKDRDIPSANSNDVKPIIVDKYEKVLEYLDLPNVFEEEIPLVIGDNIFFNVEGEVYCMPLSTQISYLKQSARDGINIDYLYDQLLVNLVGRTNPEVAISFGENGLIDSVKVQYESPVRVVIDEETGESVPFAVSAFSDYLSEYGVSGPVNDDGMKFLGEQYSLGSDADLKFKHNGDVVVGISIEQSKSAHRWNIRRNHLGVKLGSESSSLQHVFGVY